MPKEHRTPRAITMTESLWGKLGELGEELEYKGRSHSQLISEMVSAAITKWRESPYVCQSARHFVLVTGRGHVFYRLVQFLKLNSDRQKIPCVLEMKPEKRQDFLDRKPSGREEAEWFRSRWLLNHFAVWHMEEDAGGQSRESPIPPDSWPLIDSFVDRSGTDYKMADLEVHQDAGRQVAREIIVGLKDYVQWKEKESGYDRVDIPIDIPTRNLEVVVLVDAALYSNTAGESLREIKNLGLEFRNREGARCGVKEIYDPENIMEAYAGRCLKQKSSLLKQKPSPPSPEAKHALLRLSEFEKRVRLLATASARGEAVLSDRDQQTLYETFRLPERFLFYKLGWSSPPFGLEVCVNWQKALPVTDLPS
jgi:hypothetical protein